MERALIKQGGGGYTIYLPKKWTERKGLQAGSKVNVREREQSLIIEARSQQKKTITINIDVAEKQNLLHLLTHLYRRGFESITFTNLDTKTMSEIRKTTQERLLGFEIVTQSASRCTLENISEPTNEKYDSMLQRAFLIAQETISLTKEDLSRGKYQNKIIIDELKIQQDRLVLFCKRLLVKENENKDAIIQWELLTFLMHIQHTAHYAYKYAETKNLQISKANLQILERLMAYFILLSEAHTKQSLQKVHSVFSTSKQQYALCTETLEKSKGAETVVLSYVREIFRLITLAGSPVLSICLEEALAKDDVPSAK